MLAKVCHFVKSRAEDIRDAARQTLARMLACLGVEYLYTITEHLKSTLTKGRYQLNIFVYIKVTGYISYDDNTVYR